MDAGVLILGGAFGGAAALVGGRLRRRRGTATRLAALGFAPAPEHLAAVRRRFTELAGGLGHARRRTWHVGELLTRDAGGVAVHHFQANDLDALDRRAGAVGGRHDVWLIQRIEPAVTPTLSVVLAPRAPALVRAWLRRRVLQDAWGVALSVDGDASCPILAAFAARDGCLSDLLPVRARARLAEAARLGFVAAHFGDGSAAFVAAPDRRDTAGQERWVASWLPPARSESGD